MADRTHKLTDVDNDIAVAVIASLSTVAAAVVGLVGVLAQRTEPRKARELRALNDIIKSLPDGDAREALHNRRTRIAIEYGGQREPLGVFTVSYLFAFGGYLIAILALLLLDGNPGWWRSLAQGLLTGVLLAGAVFFVIGVLLLGSGIFFRIRDLWPWRKGKNFAIDGEAADLERSREPAVR